MHVQNEARATCHVPHEAAYQINETANWAVTNNGIVAFAKFLRFYGIYRGPLFL